MKCKKVDNAWKAIGEVKGLGDFKWIIDYGSPISSSLKKRRTIRALTL